MRRELMTIVLGVGLLVCPAFGQPAPLVFTDAFTAAATYDSTSWLWPAYGGPRTKYTVLELLNGDISNEQAVSGGITPAINLNELSVGSRLNTSPVGGIARYVITAVGEMNFGLGFEDPTTPWGSSNIRFPHNDVCIFGGFFFSPWQLKYSEDLDGPDNLGGMPGFDDDGDMLIDEPDEALALVATAGNRGYGPPFPGGLDGAPGIAGVDDDGNGLIDEVGETGALGSDDGDDNQGRVYWAPVMRGNMQTTSGIWTDIDPGSGGDNLFSIRDIINAQETLIEATDEIAPGFYAANTSYSYQFCGSGDWYGAMLWTGIDMANPNEVVGPVLAPGHTNPGDEVVGFLNVSATADPTAAGARYAFLRQAKWTGCPNYHRRYWVIGDGGGLAYAEPYATADLDMDGDVDGMDFLQFSLCFNGSLRPPKPICAYRVADLDLDGDVDGLDFIKFSNCFNGSLRPPKTACRPANLTAGGS